MLSILSRIRRRLRLIRHYSAPRKQTAFTRAGDIALVVSLLIAVPATWLTTLLHQPSRQAEWATGLIRHEGDGVVARVQDDGDVPMAAPYSDVAAIFVLRRDERARGWPFTMVTEPLPVELELDRLDEPGERKAETLPPTDPVRVAIDAELRRERRARLAEAWASGDMEARHSLIGWLVGAMVWWLGLSFVSYTAIHLLGFGWRVHRARRLVRRDRLERLGKCGSCGYDLRGLDYNERCPECGSLV